MTPPHPHREPSFALVISSSLLSVTPVRPRAIHHQVKKVSLYIVLVEMCRLLLSTLSSITSTLFGFSLVFETLPLVSWNENIAYNLYISNRNLMKRHSFLSRMNLDQHVLENHVIFLCTINLRISILYCISVYIIFFMLLIHKICTDLSNSARSRVDAKYKSDGGEYLSRSKQIHTWNYQQLSLRSFFLGLFSVKLYSGPLYRLSVFATILSLPCRIAGTPSPY